MTDSESHFDCNEVCNYCNSIVSKLHVIAAYVPWLNGLLEGSNRILLNMLKKLCAPGLREDNYAKMTTKDIPNNWHEYLDTAIKHLIDQILPSLKYSPNNIGPTTKDNMALHLALVEQQWLDGYATIVDHAVKCKDIFNAKLQQHAPQNVVFQPGDLVQIHATEWICTFTSIKKLIPMWSIPHCVKTRQLNSCTLETISGLPLVGVYNARQLPAFEPCKGTKLAMAE